MKTNKTHPCYQIIKNTKPLNPPNPKKLKTKEIKKQHQRNKE
ncbi:hypothetical protein HMPREF1451_00159 [Helicobacter pylori HP260BFii]|uniref:Uncharacterized protein n=1 Tax=Helicobacter pylori GAM260BSi TaxID=1159046 RepID=M3R2R3_HELPX|nr:hypothetical protein HMPREF1418_00203 [Helicobacter pylori GAM260BSi]EMH69865.1 hypothetical protein HMPREF1451_00159 [Helicobacter pylori HP260BFii]